ncbi:MAG: glycosyltransferase [Oscillochloridaceae bacterium umkhey_bin13]
MQTLVVAPFSPYPLVFGGAIRLYHLLKMLASFSEVTLIAYTSWSDQPNHEVIRHLETICKRVVLIEDKPEANSQLRARAMLSPRSFQYHSHYTEHFQRQLDQLLQAQQYQYLVVEMTQMAYFRTEQPGSIQILDMQNIEHELLLRRASVGLNPIRRLALWIEGQKFRREELTLCKKFALILTPSERETKLLQAMPGMPPVKTLPNSIDADFFTLRTTQPDPLQITFIGTTHVDANRDGLVHFMAEIFPLIEQAIPEIKLAIVGGRPPADIRAFAERPNVVVTGYVKDVRDYMDQAAALIVPLRSGGGTRLKILEGLSYGVPTVSTSIGAEGLGLINGEEILIADTPREFADQVVRLIRDAALQQRLCHAGRRVAEQQYSWQAVGQQLQSYLGLAQ